MKRPMCIFALAIGLGVFSSRISGSLESVLVLCLFVFCVGCAVFLKVKIHRKIILGFILLFVFGALEYGILNEIYTGKLLKYSGNEIIVSGTIDSEADIRESRVSYIVKTDSITCDGKTEKIISRISISVLFNDQPLLLEYGSKIKAGGLFSIPKERRNPGSFDYRQYLAGEGVSGLLYVRSEEISIMGKGFGNPVVQSGLWIREKLLNVLKKSLPPEQAGLMCGMLLGYREDLSKDVQRSFSDAGLTHIMAVSGANVAFIALPLLFLLKKLKVGRKMAAVITILLLISFLFITGMEPSVMRAVFMAVVVLIAKILDRESDVFASLSFAALLMLVINPYNLFNIGFQLSFAATLSLVLFFNTLKESPGIRRLPVFIRDVLCATMAAQLGVLPLTVLYFNRFSIISIVSNLIVVPVVEMITILGSIMAIVGQVHIFLSQLVGYINCTLLTFVLAATKLSASLPFAAITVSTPPIALIIIYYLVLLYKLWLRPVKNYCLGVRQKLGALAIFTLIIAVPLLLPRGLDVVFLDVGQGDSLFVRTYSGKTMLVDGGGKTGVSANGAGIGELTVEPFLLDYGVTKPDVIVATHGHEDHIQGLEAVLRDFGCSTLVLPDIEDKKPFEQLLETARRKRIPVHYLDEGDSFRMDDKTLITVLNPESNAQNIQGSLNNTSLVLKLRYGKTTLLLTGDMEQEEERRLLDAGVDLEADVLKIGHHGSDTSTTSDFLSAIKPQAAIISVGANHFGHPSDRVLEELDKNDVQVFRTDLEGGIVFQSDGKRFSIKGTVSRR